MHNYYVTFTGRNTKTMVREIKTGARGTSPARLLRAARFQERLCARTLSPYNSLYGIGYRKAEVFREAGGGQVPVSVTKYSLSATRERIVKLPWGRACEEASKSNVFTLPAAQYSK